METELAPADQENLSEQVTILNAELDLSRRRVNALIGELKLHLDRGNQLAEESHRNRNRYNRHLQWMRTTQDEERTFHRHICMALLLFAAIGWSGFGSMIWLLAPSF